MLNKVLVIMLVLFAIVPTSCKDEHFSFLSKTKRLTGTSWKISSMIDTETNQNMVFSSSIYDFNEDGSLIIKELVYNTQDTTSWTFLYNDNYIRIGSNTYKIKILTQKLLGLQYGSIDVFYKPYED
ncbi:MAG: hypothetical protein A2236_10230 [Bacteroidetes bacterium RIFOXYA2_FULL_33_7]|nr:MAG: hypothetical protein A2236_10230 [Bacteroidetes bacterium RIFOXYA2_FULL_33_7]